MTFATPSGSRTSDADEARAVQVVMAGLSQLIETGAISKQQVLLALNLTGVGREAPGLPLFTFKGSGKTCPVRKLGPFTLDEIRTAVRRERKPPPPPRVQVNKGDDDDPKLEWEENPADPRYRDELVAYEQEMRSAESRAFIDKVLWYCVVTDTKTEEARAEVQAARDFLVELGRPKEEVDAISDHMIYVKHVCIKSGADVQELQQFVMGQSIPSEEQIAEAEATFRGDVPGAPDRQLAYAEDGRAPQPVLVVGVGDPVVGDVHS
jgi:hypothetical protein